MYLCGAVVLWWFFFLHISIISIITYLPIHHHSYDLTAQLIMLIRLLRYPFAWSVERSGPACFTLLSRVRALCCRTYLSLVGLL